MRPLTKHSQDAKDRAEKRRKKVRAARAVGLGWAEIGRMIGVTKQRAQQLGTKK